MNITVITTFGPKQYDVYAKRMLDSFLQYWPESVRIVAYFDQKMPGPIPAPVEIRSFPDWFVPWRQKHDATPDAHGRDLMRNRPGREYDYRRDCLRFAFKIGALTADHETDLLIWMDADVITFRPVDVLWLTAAAHPRPSWMSWVDRQRVYPECGFMAFDMTDKRAHQFMTRLRDVYSSGEVFNLRETHDSFVIQHVVQTGGWQPPRSLNNLRGRTAHHPFPFIELGKRLDHLKGSRKVMGKSPERTS